MKKAIYAPVTKIAAIVLLVVFLMAAISIGCNLVYNGLEYISEEYWRTVALSDDYDTASENILDYIRGDLPKEELVSVLEPLPLDYRVIYDKEEVERGELPVKVDSYHIDNGVFYVHSGEGSYANYGNFSKFTEAADGKHFEIYFAPQKAYLEKIKAAYLPQKAIAEKKLFAVGGFGLLALAVVVYFLFAAGRNGADTEVHGLLIDRLPVEINAALLGLSLWLAIYLGVCYIRIAEDIDSIAYSVVGSALVSVSLLLPFAFFISILRNLKARQFLNRSWTFKCLRWIYRKCKSALSLCRRTFFLVSGLGVSLLILFYTLVLMIFRDSGVWLLFMAAACGICLLALKNFDDLRKGITEVHNGNTSYKIASKDTGLLGTLCNAVDGISEGVNRAVESKMKAERMKSELITNVSHDLKTPLTSIINYSNLLGEMELAPKEANDYVRIVGQKAARLKNLTSDLFDIAKVQSGNETITLERLDFSTLVQQTLGELNDSISASGLEFVSNLADDVYMQADGKKMSRVLENLTNNVIKYAMPGTRVYYDLKKGEQDAVLEIKNISAAPLNFDPAEITERFVRGDTSRTTEGSGLGLAIAKGYTEACGGRLKVSIDGDLFKVSIRFPVVS